ncbi:MAG: bifunctional 4-hydroxy-2-oxoglutarate aldolase/2-dehydro-3-deoxy-phosphogluconate aldolase [Oscillospiraceae bacterium]|nr:bifunctional 4-hydroxy-2-oxoglutarate aldolase/2-dehydro-3-deoxy-phosphogluconate aldolase [Oscillospiraceae bacterium]
MLKKLETEKLLPVLVIENAEDAVPLARALLAGGLSFAEVTFRTAAAAQSIRRIAEELPQITVGAGTVLSVEQANAAVEAGARFLVSPGFNPAVVKEAARLGVPIFPGCITPTEFETAMAFGIKIIKFFPAEQAGGVDFLKAVSGPYPELKFIPTGGINAGNLGQYLALNCVLACGGSFMAPPKLVAAGDWDGISRLARKAIA